MLLVGNEQMQPTYWAVVQTLGGPVPNRGMGEQDWRDAKGTAVGVRLLGYMVVQLQAGGCCEGPHGSQI